jgi:hypothetical protein
MYISTDTAPTSSACVPRLTRWLEMRCWSSAIRTRMSFHALRHLIVDAEQPLDRQAERQRIGLRAEVIHALDQRDHLLPLLLLGGLLDAGVEEPDGRCRLDDRLSRRADHDVSAAVACWVLRPC